MTCSNIQMDVYPNARRQRYCFAAVHLPVHPSDCLNVPPPLRRLGCAWFLWLASGHDLAVSRRGRRPKLFIYNSSGAIFIRLQRPVNGTRLSERAARIPADSRSCHPIELRRPQYRSCGFNVSG